MSKPKLSKKYVRRVASKFGLYAGGFLLLAIAVITNVGSAPTGIGAFLVILIAVIIAYSPTIAVQLFGVKVKNPKPYFVEPSRPKLVLVGFACILCSFLGIALSVNLDWPDVVTGAIGLVCFVLPINLYMVNASVRYKRIVEYGTAEWRKLHKSRS